MGTVASSEYAQTLHKFAENTVTFVEDFGPRLQGSGMSDAGAGQRLALRRWQAALDDVITTIDLAQQLCVSAWLLPIATHLDQYLEIRGRYKLMHELYSRLCSFTCELDDPRAELYSMLGLARAEGKTGQFAHAHSLSHLAFDLGVELNDRRALARSRYLLGGGTSDLDESRVHLNCALGLYSELGDWGGQCECLNLLAIGYYSSGAAAEASELWSRVLELSRAHGDRNREAGCLNNLGLIAGQMEGDHERAFSLLRQAYRANRELGNKSWQAVNLANLALGELIRGNYLRSATLLYEAMLLRKEIGERADLARISAFAARALVDLGRLRAATVLVEGVEAAVISEATVNPVKHDIVDETNLLIAVAVERNPLLEAEVASWRAIGQALTIEALEEETMRHLAEVKDPASTGLIEWMFEGQRPRHTVQLSSTTERPA